VSAGGASACCVIAEGQRERGAKLHSRTPAFFARFSAACIVLPSLHLSSQQLHHVDAVLEGSKPQGCAVESEGDRGCEVGVGGCVRLRVRVAVWRVCGCWRVGGS